MLTKTEKEIIQQWNTSELPTVSICCIAYNHEKFICEALDGFLMQETDFSFEIVIGEDCSTDGTRKIIEGYTKIYPNIIKLVTSEKNVGMQQNGQRTMGACIGKYIAFCEGDDFWTSPVKLQKQINFLENNPDYAISCHNCGIFNNDSNVIVESFPNILEEQEMTIEHLLKGNIANTCTFVYRNYHIQLPLFFENLQVGDWPLHMVQAQNGKIKYFPDNMARYRVHSSGVWSSSNRIKQLDASILALKYMSKYFNNQYSIQINKTISNFFLEKASYYFNNHRVFLVLRCYIYAKKYSQISFLDKVKYITNCYFPQSYPKIALFYRKINFLWQKK